ncbi:MAG: hypothetical protein ACT4P6_15740 [Gemmatimonadaceae bacterium]
MTCRGAERARLVRLFALVALVPGVTPPVAAQHSRTVAGRVVVQRGSGAQPLAGRVVTLHRVGSDTAGAVDSVRSDVRGRYSFSFQPFGAEGALYFAAVIHGGVAYFTAPLGAAPSDSESTEITVFDTASTGIDIGVRGRHLAISAPSTTGNRAVVDVFELGNDSLRTLVQGRGASGEVQATWRIPLPEGAVNASVMRDAGDIAAAAVTVGNGEAAVFAPFAPGLKQLALRYELPASKDSLTIPLIEATGVLEVLLEEVAGRVSGAGIAAQGPVTVEGKSLQRFLAQNVPANAVLTISLPQARAQLQSRTWLVALLGAVLAIAISLAVFRRSGGAQGRKAGSQIHAD